MARRRTLGGAAVAATLLVALALPAGARTPPTAPAAVADHIRAREELATARRTLASVEEDVEAARALVDAADARLARTTGRLRTLATELAAAERQLDSASRAQLHVAAELATALDRLELSSARAEGLRARVDARAAEVYKRGAGAATGMLVSGIVRAEDLHGAAIAVHAVKGIVARDRQLLAESRARSRDAEATRSAVERRRRSARSTEREAADRRDHITSLLGEQRRLVTLADAARAERGVVLATLQADRAAGAVLVARLEGVARRLATDLAGVLRPPAVPPTGGPAPAWAGALPAHGQAWAPAIEAAATAVGIDPTLLAALVWTESAFMPTAVSSAGAIGLAQLMPATALGLGADPWDPIANLTGGARYLRRQITSFGSVDVGLAAYNAGPGAVRRAGGIPDIRETQLYVVQVLERYQQLRVPQR